MENLLKRHSSKTEQGRSLVKWKAVYEILSSIKARLLKNMYICIQKYIGICILYLDNLSISICEVYTSHTRLYFTHIFICVCINTHTCKYIS